MMWIKLTAQIWEEIYYSLISRGLFPEKQKGCHKGIRGTGKRLYIDQHVFNESKTKLKNIAKACIGNKKAYDMAPLMLDNKVFQNVQDIQQSHKVYRENYRKLQN